VAENETTPVNINLTSSPAPTQKSLPRALVWDYSLIPVIAIPLLLFALYEGYCYNRRKFVLQKRRVKKPPYSWPLKLEVSAPEIFESAQFYSAARRLQRRQTGEACHLDVEASVRATIDSLGYPQLQYKPNSKLPEYLVLIDRSSFRDHQAQLLHSLAVRLRREGVFVTSYYFEGDPRVCFSDDGAATVYLSDLQTRYSQDRLLILGDGDQLIDSVNGKLVSWSALFRRWNDRAVLTPEVPARWGLREKALAKQFIVLPATLDGFLALVDHFELAAPPDLRSWRQNAPDVAPPDPDAAKLLEELRSYLGEGPFQWLCACAIYPELHWDLTLHLGSLPCLGEKLIQEANLVKLVRLPWFRKGSMPDGLRSLLIQELKPAQEQAIREAIISVLEKNPAPKETHASDAQNLEIATQRYWFNPRNRQARRDLIDALQRSPEGGVVRDYTLLSSLESTSRSPLDFLLPRTLRRVLYPDGLSAFGPRTGARILLTLAVIFVGLVVVARNHKQQPEAVSSMPTPQEISQLQNLGSLPAQEGFGPRLDRAKDLFHNAKMEDACAVFQQLDKEKPGDIQIQRYLKVSCAQVMAIQKTEEDLFNQGVQLFNQGQLDDARQEFERVGKLQGLTNLRYQAKALDYIKQIDAAREEFDAAERAANRNDLDGAIAQFDRIANGGGPFASRAKTRLSELQKMKSEASANAAVKQEWDVAVQTENNNDLNRALAQFKAIAAKGGAFGSEATKHIQEINDKLAAAADQQKFDDAVRKQNAGDLQRALAEFKALAVGHGPKAGESLDRYGQVSQLIADAGKPKQPEPKAPVSTPAASVPCRPTSGYLQPTDPFQRFALIASLEPSLAPQTISGTIVGIVCDPNGDILSGVSVTATNEETALAYQGVTDTTRGIFVIPEVPPGIYRVRAQFSGFQPQEHDSVRVDVNRVTEEDFVLKVSISTAAKVGQLTVSANVKGARISVDGRSDPSWLTPYTIADLSAGAHNVEISMDGYDSFQRSVTIEGGKTTNVAGNLSTAHAEIDIVTVPPGVETLIDGKSYGLSPVRATLPPGNHTYMVKPPGMAPHEKAFTLKSAQILTIKLTLGTAFARNPVVTLIPSGDFQPWNGPVSKGQILPDNSIEGGLKPIGSLTVPPLPDAPAKAYIVFIIHIDPDGNVTPGRKTVDDYGLGPQVMAAAKAWKFNPPMVKEKPVSTAVTVKVTFPGAAVTTGIVEVRTIPPGATVLADGSPVSGQTPCSFRLSVGTHTLVVSLAGYGPIQKQVTVSENATTPVYINLASQ
jgi:hypothetical protein